MAVVNMNNQLFKENIENSGKPVMVEFWAPWCVYCRRIAPALKKVAEEYQDQIVIGQINIDDEAALAEQERIELVPTFIIYKDGKAVGSIVAPESKAQIEEFIKEALN
ncbi:MAG: thioredoxin [Oscillospiraceae bacterium]|nr:thioredoxin [Oscillospiraceae bacterium]